MTRVAVVVLNWNGGAQTDACIESIRAQGTPNTVIVLVDNHSAAAAREALRRRYGGAPDVQLYVLDDNRGYAGGNNVGIRVALATGADVVLILTQDATLGSGALQAMVDTAAADGRIGIVGAMVVDARDPQQVLSTGERLHPALLCVPRTLLRHRRTRPPAFPVGGVLGCAMLLTRRCLETAGVFDEDLFAYYEEVDLCLRARRHGFAIVCAPQAVVAHDGLRGFLRGFTTLSAELKARNLPRVMRRWAAPIDWLILAPTYVLLLVGSVVLYALRGRMDIVGALARGTVAGLRRRGGPLHAAAPAS